MGFSLVELLVVVILIGIIAAIAIPSFLSSRRATNEGSAVSTLQSISAAQATYYATIGASRSYGTLSDLGTAGLLGSNFNAATVTKGSYSYASTIATSSPGYCVKASPVNSSATKFFGVNQRGVIYQAAISSDLTCVNGAMTVGSGATPAVR